MRLRRLLLTDDQPWLEKMLEHLNNEVRARAAQYARPCNPP